LDTAVARDWDEEQEGMWRLPTARLVLTHGTVVAARTDGCRRVLMTVSVCTSGREVRRDPS
jgi:hypothetical protein